MDKELFKFYQNAVKGDICSRGRDAWVMCGGDKEKLVALTLARYAIPFFATYCHDGRGLTKEHILRHYAHLINGNRVYHGCDGAGDDYTSELYVGHKGTITATSDTLHLMWCERANVIVPQTKCTTLFLSNNDNLSVSCMGYNNIILHLFDTSKATIVHGDENTHIVAYLYSEQCELSKSDNCQKVTIRTKRRELEL